VGALGALYFDPARAAVGPLPPEGLALPADTRFVMGVDVKRLVASPFYEKYGRNQPDGRPRAFTELEEKTGLNPERDIDQVFVAGGGKASRGPGEGLVLVLGRFDRYKISRAIETEKKGVTTKNYQGTTIYLFNEAREGKGRHTGAVAFLDDDALVLGSQAAVEETIAGRLRGDTALRANPGLTALLESVKPGSTFWMVGDQTLLGQMPRSLPGAPDGSTPGMTLPALKSIVVTGDLEPLLSFDVTGEAADEAAAQNLADVVRGFLALASLQAAQKPELKQLATAVSVTTENTKVHVSGRFPYEVLDSLREQHLRRHPRKEAEAPAE